MKKKIKTRIGEVYAWHYAGNIAVAEMVDDGNGSTDYFEYAVGYWFDGNLVGDKDSVWVSDYLSNNGDIKDVRLATRDEIIHYYQVINKFKQPSQSDADEPAGIYEKLTEAIKGYNGDWSATPLDCGYRPQFYVFGAKSNPALAPKSYMGSIDVTRNGGHYRFVITSITETIPMSGKCNYPLSLACKTRENARMFVQENMGLLAQLFGFEPKV